MKPVFGDHTDSVNRFYDKEALRKSLAKTLGRKTGNKAIGLTDDNFGHIRFMRRNGRRSHLMS